MAAPAANNLSIGVSDAPPRSGPEIPMTVSAPAETPGNQPKAYAFGKVGKK